MIIAVFGDVHGNLSGMYELCRLWEEQQSKRIDLVLQTGDLGLWRSPEEMDKAARKRFIEDESELAAAEYLSGKRIARVETWFVHGNHENFSLLCASENHPLDPAGRIIFLGPGSVRELLKGRQSFTVAALGGMEYRFGKYPPPSEERVQKYLHSPSLKELKEKGSSAHVLLLHDAPMNRGLRDRFPTGSRRLTELIERLQPQFVFYGHYGDPPEAFRIGPTLCACMNFAGAKRIPGRHGAMGILRTDPFEFTFVPP